jgi:hypothetical protein
MAKAIKLHHWRIYLIRKKARPSLHAWRNTFSPSPAKRQTIFGLNARLSALGLRARKQGGTVHVQTRLPQRRCGACAVRIGNRRQRAVSAARAARECADGSGRTDGSGPAAPASASLGSATAAGPELHDAVLAKSSLPAGTGLPTELQAGLQLRDGQTRSMTHPDRPKLDL